MTRLATERVVVVGGAGFIGSHFVDRLLADGCPAVVVYDNFSSGQPWHLAHHGDDPRLSVVRGEVADVAALAAACQGNQVVIHLASNPDIAKAMTDPAVDFHEGTALTHSVVEAARLAGVERVLYASGSGVYGELGEVEAWEDYGPLLPTSTYGASKLAGEAMLSAYASMFGVTGIAFRFGNVVGPRQTHGVGFDFVRRLRKERTQLDVLGNGMQSKSYVWVGDVVDAVLRAHERSTRPYDVFNVATGDYITVRDIVGLALDVVGLDPEDVDVRYAASDRGWKGDVPIVRLSTDKIRGTGWSRTRGSADAMRDAMTAMLDELSVSGT